MQRNGILRFLYFESLYFSKMHKRVGNLGIENQQDYVYEDRGDYGYK